MFFFSMVFKPSQVFTTPWPSWSYGAEPNRVSSRVLPLRMTLKVNFDETLPWLVVSDWVHSAFVDFFRPKEVDKALKKHEEGLVDWVSCNNCETVRLREFFALRRFRGTAEAHKHSSSRDPAPVGRPLSGSIARGCQWSRQEARWSS